MKPSLFLDNSFDTSHGNVFRDRVNLTQKEVGYVYEKAECVAELQLRRLRSTWVGGRSSDSFAVPTVSLDSIARLPITREHRAIVLHALSGQLYAFSGGALTHDDLLCPLWLSLMLDGNGLRRMAVDTAQYAERVMALVGPISPQMLSERYVTDPWKAYRLGLFQMSRALLERVEESRVDELMLRVRLATSPLDSAALAAIEQIAEKGTDLKLSLLSSVVAYGIKQKQEVPPTFVGELESWLSACMAQPLNAKQAPLVAQVINAINLVFLESGKIDAIETNMHYLLSAVTPQIVSHRRRAHVEGNAFYQRSILARRRNDKSGEVSALLRAMALDQNFATLYYRMAQVLHDQGDARAEPFYELALALSPLDYPTANDYGCWLLESGKQDKFESWVALCKALYPDRFSEDTNEAAK